MSESDSIKILTLEHKLSLLEERLNLMELNLEQQVNVVDTRMSAFMTSLGSMLIDSAKVFHAHEEEPLQFEILLVGKNQPMSELTIFIIENEGRYYGFPLIVGKYVPEFGELENGQPIAPETDKIFADIVAEIGDSINLHEVYEGLTHKVQQLMEQQQSRLILVNTYKVHKNQPTTKPAV